MANPRRKQCGALDCKMAFNANRMREWNRAYKDEHGMWPHHRYGEGQRARERRRRQEKGHWRTLYPERAAAYDARRRALVQQAQTAEAFAPIDVHTRDEWTCKLCHQPIDPSIAWPDPMSASVDHIVPLSRGGAHSMANVQSAHLSCNSSKGDREMVDVVVRFGQAS
jgi:5-methylcytosine-specific restriction endonuclease McrA